ncbi:MULTISPECIES: Npun_R2821/Npun_R2822 family protein [Nostoc]|uniref:Methionine synthase n=1 Tax=Nostoc paludosum FACHB-159 TaxID=2692908 RepID=A0ABR8JY28_9NOSO|nr:MULTISPECIES: Npun_R2821/Npun_R2822 family protein [Nostoc]MBD2676516.1 methionine synthase [Nostoc sp. FACHB-857]MBD2732350.1 methionine synthase [Nostoc paludosum FACHB-159]
MKSFGIYTLANDTVYDQLVALLNSIEVNVGENIPVCVIPYNQQLDLVKQEIKSRKNVTLFEDWEAIHRWDNFINELWDAHPRANDSKLNRPGWYKGFVHRKFASFNGDFERFVFYDADSLAMKPIDDVFEKLDNYDLIFNDWEHAKPREKTQLNLEVLEKVTQLTETQLRAKIHCDSFFGSKRLLFGGEDLDIIKQKWIEEREFEWIRPGSWWSSSGIFVYITLYGDPRIFNFTLSPNPQDRTGNCANADRFVNINNVLYNQDGLKPIHRIHYMSYSSIDFTRLCQGEDVNIDYRDEFLYYRFLKEPERKPKELKAPSVMSQMNRFLKKSRKKLQRMIS